MLVQEEVVLITKKLNFQLSWTHLGSLKQIILKCEAYSKADLDIQVLDWADYMTDSLCHFLINEDYFKLAKSLVGNLIIIN